MCTLLTNNLENVQVSNTKGASIYDVRKILEFFDPPPLSEFYVLFVRKFGVFLDPLSPLCGRHIWKPSKYTYTHVSIPRGV